MLSRREKDVVALLLQGKSNKQIALALGVSERTIEFHLNNIYGKLQVASRVELILKLGKTTGVTFANLVESTVDSDVENIHNGNQPAQSRATHSWRNTFSLIKKEVAMTITISFEELQNTLRTHPVIFGLLLFLAGSTAIRYVLIALGLFYWFSYVLMGISVIAGCIYLGRSWKTILSDKSPFRPLTILAITTLVPLTVAILDEFFLYTIARALSPNSVISFVDISNRAMWAVSANGELRLQLHRSVMSDTLWLIGMAGMILFFTIGFLSDKRRSAGNLSAI